MALDLPEKIGRLQVHVDAGLSGELLRESQYLFTYASDDTEQPAVALRIADAMTATLTSARTDARIQADLLQALQAQWNICMNHAT